MYVYFGDPGRDLDVGCWDHEIIATGFHRIAGVRIEPGSHDDNPQHGTLFIVGLDAADHRKVRLEELVVASDRTVASPRVATNSGGTAPAWEDDATAPPAFLVWRFVVDSSAEEVLFGGGDRFFTVDMLPNGLAPFATPVANPSAVRVQQAQDISATHFAVDDGTHVYIVPRGPTTDAITLPAPLDGAAGSGAPDGAVIATQDMWFGEVNVLGLRVPRHATPPARTSLQLYDAEQVHDKPLVDVTPTGAEGPYLTAGVVARDVGELGLLLAAVVTTFGECGVPAVQRLAMTPIERLTTDFDPRQYVALETDVVPIVTGGKFRAAFDRNLLVVYPRRTAADPPTHSACYRALNNQCLARCDQATCAP